MILKQNKFNVLMTSHFVFMTYWIPTYCTSSISKAMRILTIFVCLMLGVSDVGYNGGKKVMTYLHGIMGSRKENELQKGLL